MPKKQSWTLWDFSTSLLSENSKKIEGGPFGKIFFSKKSLTRAENTLSRFGPFEFLRCKNTTSQAFKVFYLNLLSKNWSEEKKGHCYSRAFFLENAPTKKWGKRIYLKSCEKYGLL